MTGELVAIGTKGIGEDERSSGLDVVIVYLCHQSGVGEVQFVKTTVKGHTALMQQGAHGTICQQGSKRGKKLDKFIFMHN